MPTDSLKQVALRNAIACVDLRNRFPAQVFVGVWKEYFFFDSDALFEQRFIEVKNLLLREESASVIAVANLRNMDGVNAERPEALYLDADTSAEEYSKRLAGDRSPNSWIFLKDRYACASDKFHWAIYCEKENDIAVWAIDDKMSEFCSLQVARLLGASSVRAIQELNSERSFDFQKLVPKWKSVLDAQYRVDGEAD